MSAEWLVEELDLLDPASIDAFAERFLAGGRPLHILVNSAGVMANPLTLGRPRVRVASPRRTISGTSS